MTVVIDGLVMARMVADSSRILNDNEPKLVELLSVNAKCFKQGKNKERILYIDDHIDTWIDNFPILDSNIRPDVFAFWNTCLTNSINRILANKYMDRIVKNGEIIQGRVTIDSYSHDIKELLEVADEDPLLEEALRHFAIYTKDDIDEEELEEIEEVYGGDNVTNAIFIERVNIISAPKFHLKNTRLKNGETLMLTDPKYFPTEDFDNEGYETIVLGKNEYYIIDNVKEHYTVRQFNPMELWSDKLIDYTK